METSGTPLALYLATGFLLKSPGLRAGKSRQATVVPKYAMAKVASRVNVLNSGTKK